MRPRTLLPALTPVPMTISASRSRSMSCTHARRAVTPPRLVLRADNLAFDTASQRVIRGDREISLTSRELAYLEYFMRNPGVVITRGMLENALWNRDTELSSNVIDVYIKRLRSKIEFDDMRPLLVTV